MKKFTNYLTSAQRITVFVAALIVVSVAIFVWFLSEKQNHAVLFDGLSQEQAGVLVESLDKLKVDYKIAEGGSAILVRDDILYETRIKLASNGLSLSGHAGFELFDEVDYGLTEFSQKVLLQRALQGELARTISAIDEIRAARVHIVLGEQRLFKEGGKAKAAVTVVLEKSQELYEEQVSGIQQLVASSVRDLTPDSVIVSDSRGVVLSTSSLAEKRSVAKSMDAKERLEASLVEKIGNLLTHLYSDGMASVRVNVELNFDERLSEVEEIIPANSSSGQGFLVKDKNTRSLDSTPGRSGESLPGSSSIDKAYSFGKRVERTVYGVGRIKRISVSIVVPEGESEERIAKLESLVSAAAGLDEARGDSISVQALSKVEGWEVPVEQDVFEAVVADEGTGDVRAALNVKSQAGVEPIIANWDDAGLKMGAIGVISTTILATLGILIFWGSRRREQSTLSDEERQKVLVEIRSWLAE